MIPNGSLPKYFIINTPSHSTGNQTDKELQLSFLSYHEKEKRPGWQSTPSTNQPGLGFFGIILPNCTFKKMIWLKNGKKPRSFSPNNLLLKKIGQNC